MSKAEVLKYLIEDTIEKIEQQKKYNIAYEKARKEAKENGGYYWGYLIWDGNIPKKTPIKHNLKARRRISLELEKEIG